MNSFVPHKIDDECSFESAILGDVKAGFPSPAEDIREKLDLVKQGDCAQYHIDVPQDIKKCVATETIGLTELQTVDYCVDLTAARCCVTYSQNISIALRITILWRLSGLTIQSMSTQV